MYSRTLLPNFELTSDLSFYRAKVTFKIYGWFVKIDFKKGNLTAASGVNRHFSTTPPPIFFAFLIELGNLATFETMLFFLNFPMSDATHYHAQLGLLRQRSCNQKGRLSDTLGD